MENSLLEFMFNGNQIDIITLDNDILFNPYQIGDCLGIAAKTVKNHMASMNEKQVVKLTNSDSRLTGFRKLNNTGENFVTESGVYYLIFKSRKPDAEKFANWVTDDVLPQIRKTGGYIPTQQNNAPMTDEQIMAHAYVIATNTIKLREQELAAMKTQIAQKECDLSNASILIEELEPKGEYYDTVLKSDKGINISTIADDYGISGAALNQLLYQWHVQFKRGKRYFLYAEHKGLGYTVSETFPGHHKDGTPVNFNNMKWTELGRRFIYNLMKQHGYKTLVEQAAENAAIVIRTPTIVTIQENAQISMLEV